MPQTAFWVIQIPGWLLVLYLVIAQCTSAISYDLGVRMGTQEPVSNITEIGVAFWKGLAVGDLVFYTPVLALGLIGHWIGSGWGTPVLGAALGITVYWPIVCLITVRTARQAPGWYLANEYQYWIVLPVIALWGLVGLVLVAVNP